MIWGKRIIDAWAEAIGGALPEEIAISRRINEANFQWDPEGVGVDIQELDQLNAWSLALIMAETHRRENRHSAPPMLTLTGLAGECCFDWALYKNRIAALYHKPERAHYRQGVDNPTTCDFEIAENGPKIELYTIPAGDRYQNAICDENKFGYDWDLFVVAKIESLNFYASTLDAGFVHVDALSSPPIQLVEALPPHREIQTVVGKIRLCGFGHRLDIKNQENGWIYEGDGNPPCTKFPGFYRSLSELEGDESYNMSALWLLLSKYSSGVSSRKHPLDILKSPKPKQKKPRVGR